VDAARFAYRGDNFLFLFPRYSPLPLSLFIRVVLGCARDPAQFFRTASKYPGLSRALDSARFTFLFIPHPSFDPKRWSTSIAPLTLILWFWILFLPSPLCRRSFVFLEASFSRLHAEPVYPFGPLPSFFCRLPPQNYLCFPPAPFFLKFILPTASEGNSFRALAIHEGYRSSIFLFGSSPLLLLDSETRGFRAEP